MKNSKERVLAYKLAKEIDHKDLGEVSGGVADATTQQTVHPTGNSSSPDFEYDVKVDW
jgi:hypothetical protein